MTYRWFVPALALAAGLAAQTPPAPRIRGPIDGASRVRVPAAVPVELHTAQLLGPVSGATPVARLLLVLRPSAQQEVELAQLLRDQEVPLSPRYHQWLTPDEFGRRFGVSDADVATVTSWLASHGLRATSIAHSRLLIEASGSAAAVASALGTPLSRYRAGKSEFTAAAGPVTIPAALAGVLAGPVSLTNFPRRIGPSPNLNSPDPPGPPVHQLAPADLAIIYGAAPLYAQGLDGSGIGVAVVARSDFPASGVATFRQTLLPQYAANLPDTVINGTDPGVVPEQAEIDEATLDSEWATALAPAAHEYFVVSQSTVVSDGSDLSAEYIVDHALAPIMSNSFGQCEASLGGPGSAANLFFENLYEQAAAEGITVVVSSGDSGSAGCDSPTAPAMSGLGVNGLASTPYNLAVGGTQFKDSPADWSIANNADGLSSVLGYLPEVAWDDSCATCRDIAASGGGPSEIYAKPPWQTGPGVPPDGARDLPDISLAAGSGVPYVLGVTCGVASCPPKNPDDIGPNATTYGTSAAAQAFAGMVALLVQKTGSWQGLINPELYALAAAQTGDCNATGPPDPTCIFNDVTAGSNAVACAAGSPNCTNGLTSLPDGTPAFPAGPGYDLATGLGSINLANLVAAWPTASPIATTTTLQAAPNSITHGQDIQFTVAVTTAGPTPSGTVEILDGTGPGATVLGTAQLQAGTASLTLDNLPGGADTVVARFAGTAAFDPSSSAPITVSVAPEASTVALSLLQGDLSGNWSPVNSAYYGAPLALTASVAGQSLVPASNGSLTFTQDGESLTPAPLALNADGGAGLPLAILPLGTHHLGASFSGNPGLMPSSAPDQALLVTPTATVASIPPPIITPSPSGGIHFYLNGSITTAGPVLPGTTSGGTGTFTDANGHVILTAPSGGQIGNFSPVLMGGAGGLVTLPARPIQITFQYSGDGNFLPSTSPAIDVDGGTFHFNVMGATSATVAPGGAATFQVTVTMDSPLANPVSLTCPTGGGTLSCTISPSSVSLTQANPTATFAVLIANQASTALAASRLPAGTNHSGAISAFSLLAGFSLLLWADRRRARPIALALILAGSVACGGAPQNSTNSAPPPPAPQSITIQGQAGYDYNYVTLAITTQ